MLDATLQLICVQLKNASRRDKPQWEALRDARCAELNAACVDDTPFDRALRLWRAVLAVAVTDYHTGHAGIYTFIGSKGFEELCERCCYEPGYVRRKLVEHRKSANWDKDIETIEREWMIANDLAPSDT